MPSAVQRTRGPAGRDHGRPARPRPPAQRRARRVAALLALFLTTGLLAGCSSGVDPSGGVGSAAAPGCISSQTPSGAPAVLLGAPEPIGGDRYVSDRAAWGRLSPAARRERQRALSQTVALLGESGCVQTTAQFHVTVSPAPAVSPAPGAGPGGGAAPVGFDGAAPPDGCRAGPRRTTRCDTLYGFGQGSTPFTVSGTISYGGNPVCVNYVGGRICNGWFGVWGADGIPDNGNSGSGLGTSALAVASVGGIGAEAQSDPTALYVSRAPSGQDSDLTVRSYTTLLDLSVGTEPDSAQCAPTKITNTIVTPSATRPQAAVQWPISCVDEIAVDSLGGRAARTGPVSTLLGAQRLLGQGRNAAALASLVAAASAAHQTLVATAHAGLPTAAQRPSDATVERSGCPVLNAALVPDGGHPPPFACTQGSFPVWQAVIPGQSLVSSQLTTEAIAESAGTTGLFHLVLAFDTVEVGECWPAAACR